MFERCCPCFTIDYFQPYFDVSTADIKHRFITSLIPFNKMFYVHYKAKPDLYGPLWIYTTLIVILAISGNFSRGLAMGDEFTYNFKFVPIAAAVVYGIGIGLPFALKLLMRMLGSGFFSSSFIEVSKILNFYWVLTPLNLSIGYRHLWIFILIVHNNCIPLCYPC